jgi:acrylyl-CoA reductase (NADPH)
MPSAENKVFRVYEEQDGSFVTKTEAQPVPEPAEGEVLIRVHYSSLNYKDALSATGNKGVTRRYPHTPGTDAAGIVVKSRDNTLREGNPVIVTGYDLGMNTNGGWAGYICVPAGWVVPLPEGLSLKESMMLGTAGFTAELALNKLELNGLKPAHGPVLVTGATGGVGCIAVMLLNQAGYNVVAVSGKLKAPKFLKAIGAQEVISPENLENQPVKPLLQQKWAGVIDD